MGKSILEGYTGLREGPLTCFGPSKSHFAPLVELSLPLYLWGILIGLKVFPSPVIAQTGLMTKVSGIQASCVFNS